MATSVYCDNVGTAVRLSAVTCCECGTPFGVESSLYNTLLNTRRTFHCPNGHGMHFTGETEEERLKKELAREARRREILETDLRAERQRRQSEERRAAAARGQVTRLKNRAANGMCPCCNRHFTNLERHMHTKHPDYTKETEEESPEVETPKRNEPHGKREYICCNPDCRLPGKKFTRYSATVRSATVYCSRSCAIHARFYANRGD